MPALIIIFAIQYFICSFLWAKIIGADVSIFKRQTPLIFSASKNGAEKEEENTAPFYFYLLTAPLEK